MGFPITMTDVRIPEWVRSRPDVAMRAGEVLLKHFHGETDDLTSAEYARRAGGELLSAWVTNLGNRFWLLTEGGVTTILDASNEGTADGSEAGRQRWEDTTRDIAPALGARRGHRLR